MAFKDALEQVLLITNQTMREYPHFDAGSKELAADLANDIQRAIGWEDPEDDTAIHNAVAEEINIFLSTLPLREDLLNGLQAHYFLINQVSELLRERNEQIHLSTILGGSGV